MRIYKIAVAAHPYGSLIVNKLAPNILSSKWNNLEAMKSILLLKKFGDAGISSYSDWKSFDAATRIDPVLGKNYDLYRQYIVAFGDASDANPEIKAVLGSLLTKALPYVREGLAADSEVVYGDKEREDFKSVLRYYGKYGATTRTEQYPMFLTLFKEFSRQISSAASKSNPALATAVTGEALLNPSAMAKVAKLSKPEPEMFKISNELIDDIFSDKHDASYGRENFEIVKETLMKHFGLLTVEQRSVVEKQRRKDEFSGSSSTSAAPTSSGGSPVPSSPSVVRPYTPEDNQWLKPGFLTSITIFFNQYNGRLLKLPD